MSQQHRIFRENEPDGGDSVLQLLHTALHHLGQRLHRCLLRTLEPTLGQEGTNHHLQGPSSGQMIVLSRTGSCFTATAALEIHLIACDVEKTNL